MSRCLLMVSFLFLIMVSSLTYPLSEPDNLNPDINGDGVVDISDLVLVAKHFGMEYELKFYWTPATGNVSYYNVYLFAYDGPDDLGPSGKESLFSVGVEFQGDLNDSTISGDLRQKFIEADIPLSDNASVSVETDASWLITSDSKEYIIRRQGNKLNIYEGYVLVDNTFHTHGSDAPTEKNPYTLRDTLYESRVIEYGKGYQIKVAAVDASNDDDKIVGPRSEPSEIVWCEPKPWDLNQDKVCNILDIVLVARRVK